ncbi:STT3 domain-containing protein [Haloglomus litoreum]|uniref:STT3 domain-containing protein n=1 Tax=Haloglomus litoreum TaxID=3034026 RepID=UPI0023E8B3F8|nr:STT3 domain-containing protein [Haloglomus sp. DT116]
MTGPVGRRRGALLASLGFLALVRLLPLPSVFRDGSVVLPSNDPYYYRYWVDVMHAGGAPWDLPAAVANGEPLLVTVLWLVSLPVAGSQWATGAVLAWYPVVTTVLTGYLVYRLGTYVSDDHRVGLAAVLLLATVPAHAIRTVVGFADHHAFDYLWLTMTAYALTVLLDRPARDRTTWLLSGGLAVGLAGQVLAWNAGPLLIVPAGLAVAVGAFDAVGRATGRPSSLVPVVVGVGGGAGLVLLAHAGLGWQSTATAASLGLLLLGTLGVHAATEAVRRAGAGPGALAGVGLAGLVATGTALWLLAGGVPTVLEGGLARLTARSPIGEVAGLGTAFGPVLGPLILLGFAPFLALPGIALAVRQLRRRRDIAWVPVLVYVLYFTGLALVQRRFAGELAPTLAVVGGFGFVWVLAWFELITPPATLRPTDREDPPAEGILHPPDRTRLALLGGIGSIVLGTGTLFTGIISERLSIDPEAVRAAKWMRAYAGERGWVYPETYVLSEWDRNRMFNHFVNGQAESYAYAEQVYEAFLFSSDPETWYGRLDGRVGFVVTTDLDDLGSVASRRTYTRLHRFLGSAAGGTDGLGHYRAVYASPDGGVKVFTLVPGATLAGRTDPTRERVRVSTTVELEGATDAGFDYVRETTTDEDGAFSVRVAHPGRYAVGDGTVVVTERAVTAGETIATE